MSIHSRILNRLSWSSLSTAAATVARAWSRRRVIGRLGVLDDYMLADIGVTRQDIQSVLAESLFVDPSEKLAERAQEARRARHAAMRDVIPDDRFAIRAPSIRRAPDRHAA